GRLIAAGCDGNKVVILDAVTGKRLKAIGGISEFPFGVEFSPDGKALHVASDTFVHTFDVASEKELSSVRVAASVFALAVSPNGKLAACGHGADDRTLTIVDLENNREHARLRLSAQCGGVVFVNDTTIASIEGKDLVFYDVGKQQVVSRKTFSKSLTSLAVAWPNRDSLIVGDFDGTIIRYHVDPMTVVKQVRVSYSPVEKLSGRLVGDDVLAAFECRDQIVRVWSLGRAPKSLATAGHEVPVSAAWFANDLSSMMTTANDGTVRTWDLRRPGSDA